MRRTRRAFYEACPSARASNCRPTSLRRSRCTSAASARSPDATSKSRAGRSSSRVRSQQEGRLGFWRWASMWLGIAGTYRKHETVDVVYERDGRRRSRPACSPSRTTRVRPRASSDCCTTASSSAATRRRRRRVQARRAAGSRRRRSPRGRGNRCSGSAGGRRRRGRRRRPATAASASACASGGGSTGSTLGAERGVRPPLAAAGDAARGPDDAAAGDDERRSQPRGSTSSWAIAPCSRNHGFAAAGRAPRPAPPPSCRARRRVPSCRSAA